jgi:hypothetical protein
MGVYVNAMSYSEIGWLITINREKTKQLVRNGWRVRKRIGIGHREERRKEM